MKLKNSFGHGFGARNNAIAHYRSEQHGAAHQLALLVNSEWFDRMWATPDMAMCLGRYDHLEPIGDGAWRAMPTTE